jgi:hypothetical protein
MNEVTVAEEPKVLSPSADFYEQAYEPLYNKNKINKAQEKRKNCEGKKSGITKKKLRTNYS